MYDQTNSIKLNYYPTGMQKNNNAISQDKVQFNFIEGNWQPQQ